MRQRPAARAARGLRTARVRERPALRASGHRRLALTPPRTVTSELARLQRTGQISASAAALDNGVFNQALAVEKRLSGTRRSELTAVTVTLHGIAASGQLTASRLPALFTTLSRNVQWWTHGPLLAADQRVEFSGSQLVWQYYPGQGIQLQVLGTFGRANGLYTSGAGGYPALEQLMAEMIPLAAQRAGGLAWEYDFNFDGGRPPWTSAMSQATGLQALSHAYLATRDPSYLSVAGQALPLFSAGPPAGVSVAAPSGTRFLQYTFAPGTSIINAFLQTLIGLDTYAHVSGDPRAERLFAAGNAEAMSEVPRFDTGAWSLYQPGLEDTLSYHVLVTGFLHQLCTMTSAPVYCTTAQHFAADETHAPGPRPADRPRSCQAPDAAALPALQGVPCRSHDHPGHADDPAHQRNLRLRRAQLHGPGRSPAPEAIPCCSRRPTWPATQAGSPAPCRSAADPRRARQRVHRLA